MKQPYTDGQKYGASHVISDDKGLRLVVLQHEFCHQYLVQAGLLCMTLSLTRLQERSPHKCPFLNMQRSRFGHTQNKTVISDREAIAAAKCSDLMIFGTTHTANVNDD